MPGTPEEWLRYWQSDDALFRSETGAPGASGADLIAAFCGECATTPETYANPLWRHPDLDGPRQFPLHHQYIDRRLLGRPKPAALVLCEVFTSPAGTINDE